MPAPSQPAPQEGTPWRERFQYALPAAETGADRDRGRWRFAKQFLVPPFLPMNVDYRCPCGPPRESLSVQAGTRRHGRDAFDSTLAPHRRPRTARNLAAALASFPLLIAAIIAMIHWQAVKPWLKGTPSHADPASAADVTDR